MASLNSALFRLLGPGKLWSQAVLSLSLLVYKKKVNTYYCLKEFFRDFSSMIP